MTRNMAIDCSLAIQVNASAPSWVLAPLIRNIQAGCDYPGGQLAVVGQREMLQSIGRR